MKNQVKLRRVMAQLTQSGLAEKAGVSRQTIHAIESEKYIPSTVLALRLSEFFGCTVNELFILEEKDRKI